MLACSQQLVWFIGRAVSVYELLIDPARGLMIGVSTGEFFEQRATVGQIGFTGDALQELAFGRCCIRRRRRTLGGQSGDGQH